MEAAISFIRSHVDRRRFYLREERDEIAQNNLSTLRYASLFTVILLIILLTLAFLLIDGWTPSPYHLAFLPVSLALCAAAWLTGDSAGYRKSVVLCIAFQAIMYVFIMLIDTLGGPEAPTSFVQLACVALPSLFVLPAWISYGLLGLAEAFYAFMVLTTKNSYIAQYDIYGMIVGIFFSLCVSQLVMVSRLNAYELKLRYEAMSKQDTLSCLYNKRAFFDAARAYFEKRNPGSSCSLSIIDIDDFKKLNDTSGHDVGDKVLARTGDTLMELYRPTDLIARFGGDEFLVLADRMVDENIIRRRYDELSARIAEEAAAISGMTITFSMGTVIAADQDVDFSAMFQQADEALYAAKQTGKNDCVIKRYHGERTQSISDR